MKTEKGRPAGNHAGLDFQTGKTKRNIFGSVIKMTMRISLITAMIGFSMALQSCRTEEPAKEAAIDIRILSASAQEISFALIPENAVSVSYSFAKAGENGNFETVETSDSIAITRTGLEEGTEYVIRAYATNADGLDSEYAEKTAVTTENASVEIEVLSKTSSSVRFALTMVNAVSHSYAIASGDDDIESMPLQKAEGGDRQEHEVEGLQENTRYTIIATATNKDSEESERSYKTFRTETEPAITIEQIEADYDKATARISSGNASKAGYIVTEKGAGVPEKEEFKSISITEGSAVIIISGLEPLTSYTLHVFGISSTGYEGSVISQDFTTSEYEERPFEMTVSNISCNNADINITFDKSVYGKYYFVAASTSTIPNPDSYDFVKYIENPGVFPPLFYIELDENSTRKLRTWDGVSDYGIELGGSYYAGAIPEFTDGTLDESSLTWILIELSEPVIGESSVACNFNVTSTTLNGFSFRIEPEEEGVFDCAYVNLIEGTPSDMEQAGMDALRTIPVYPGKDTTISWLSPGTTYTAVYVAKDKEGKLGEIRHSEITTASIDFEGDATCEVSLKEITETKAVFDCVFGEGTQKVQYYYSEKQYYDESDFLYSLKVNSYTYITSDGEIPFEGLNAETDYVFGFCPVDENGMPGKCIITEASTKGFVFDGNPQANVSVEILSCKKSDIYGYTLIYELTPNEHVSKFFTMVYCDDTNYITENSFIQGCLSGSYNGYSEKTQISGYDGKGEFAGNNSYIWVFAIDTDGKFLPISKTPVEETFE